MVDGPRLPPTTPNLPAAPPWAIGLAASVRDGFARVDERLNNVVNEGKLTNERLNTQDTTLKNVVHESKRTNSRLTELEQKINELESTDPRITKFEERIGELESRLGKNSTRVRAESGVNLKQDALIAEVIVAQQETNTKVDSVAAKMDRFETALEKNTALSVEMKQMFVDAAKNPRVRQLASGILLIASLSVGYAIRWLQSGIW